MSEQQHSSSPPPYGGVPAHHTEFPSNAISNAIDTIIDRIGFLCSWLWVVVVGVILYAVIGRYAFEQGTILLEMPLRAVTSSVGLLAL